jgi:hypothetical protein
MNVVWWWAPWISIAGTWNSLAQIGLVFLTFCVSGVTWLVAFGKNKPRNRLN